MTDYAKWKVVDLKAELKRRGIPQTGLKVKQNFIDKLLEADNAAAGSEGAEEGAAPEQGIEQETAEPKQAPIVEQDNANIEQQSQAPPEPETVKSPEGERQAEFGEAPREGVRDSAASEGKETQETHPDQTAPQQPQETPEQVTGQQAPEDAKEQLQERMDIERPQEESAAPATTSKQSPSTEQPSSATGEEAVDDMRKRKRRSPSPQPALDPIVQKKVKGEDGGPRVLLKEDVGVDNLPQRVVSDAGDVAMKEATTSEDTGEVRESKERAPEAANDEAKKTAHPSSEHDAEIQRDQVSHTKREKEHEESPSRDVLKDGDEGRIVEPALHPATPALYIRNFMRPLQPANLKNYLISLATPPTKSPDPDIILDFFLDSIKTHCFVSFANISAASRVRSSLHGTVWPNERDRKPLWVDFIPEEKTRQWISIEQDSEGRGRGGPRWEVVYEETRNGIDAILQEAPSLTAAPSVPKAPLGPRGGFVDRDPRRGPPASADPRARGEGFKALDELFKSTTAKPKLYYLPVPKEVAARRLDKFDELARKGPYPRPGGDETRRITFENTDSFVDQGPEYAVRRRGGRGRGGGYGGPWRDSWRGRGR
ncbi:SAP domain-containing protein [Paecilomyces variotii No. 5]|uniref:SAP domain-containing protein n=1 Tax=Byssochlamys spectabilis (strain No. 5 / NBRC 109023) TaxID=1356009 RepID=V5HRF7_BYSSN|nr:SAP domain-containing protein [Paecilomyces variotii No. 5]